MGPTGNLDPRWEKAVTGGQVFVLVVEPVAEGQKPEGKDLEAFSFQKIVVLWWLADGQFLDYRERLRISCSIPGSLRDKLLKVASSLSSCISSKASVRACNSLKINGLVGRLK